MEPQILSLVHELEASLDFLLGLSNQIKNKLNMYESRKLHKLAVGLRVGSLNYNIKLKPTNPKTAKSTNTVGALVGFEVGFFVS